MFKNIYIFVGVIFYFLDGGRERLNMIVSMFDRKGFLCNVGKSVK